MSRKVTFRSKCPSCDNNHEFIEWRHRACGGAYYLYTDGDIVCQRCDQRNNLLDMRFSCGTHECWKDYNETLNYVIYIINNMGIDKDFKLELLNNITMRRHQFN